jgi:hypothetical protein
MFQPLYQCVISIGNGWKDVIEHSTTFGKTSTFGRVYDDIERHDGKAASI